VLRTKSSTLLLPGQITVEHIPAVAAEYDGGEAYELNRATLFSVVSCEDAVGVYSVAITILGWLANCPSERYISSRARTNPLAYASCSAVTVVGNRNCVGVGVMAAGVTLRQWLDDVFIGESSSSNTKSDSDIVRLRGRPAEFKSKFIATLLSHDIIVLVLSFYTKL